MSILTTYHRRLFSHQLARTNRGRPCRIMVGASGIRQPGWIPVEQDVLDILNESDWERYFSIKSIEALLAEHVWEHLTLPEGARAASNCYRYLKPGGYIRVAVPDGLNPNPQYIELVRPGGSGAGSKDHKVLYTYRTLGNLFEKAGFDIHLLEYFDETGSFNAVPWEPNDGLVRRSIRYDARNKELYAAYTSIIIDAKKTL